MPVSESMFMFKIFINELESFCKHKDFIIKGIFADIFELKLRDPNQKRTQRIKIQTNLVEGRGDQHEIKSHSKARSGQFFSFVANILNLYQHMKDHHLEISLWNKNCPLHLLGSTEVEWSRKYLDYLIALYDGLETQPVTVVQNCSVYKKNTSKLIAHLKISVTFMALNHNGIGKQLDKVKPDDNKSCRKEEFDVTDNNTVDDKNNEARNKCSQYDLKNNHYQINNQNNKIEHSMSETSVANKTHIQIATTETKSFSTIQKKYSFSDYIYCNADKAIPTQLYYVGYMTSTTKDSPNKKERALVPVPCSGKCLESLCEQNKGTLPTPDERYLIDYTNMGKECCTDVAPTKVEEVLGTMKAKLTMGDTPCECTCECFFDLAKKITTYRKINSRPEMAKSTTSVVTIGISSELQAKKMKDDTPKKSVDTVISIKKNFAKALKKNNTESSKPVTKKKPKQSKKKKQNKIETTYTEKKKFRYNYGYTAPHIGHSQCAMTSAPVPVDMGWLWTADNIPGLEFRPKWKPGAADKRVVKLLKAAKNTDDGFQKKRKKTLEDSTKKTKHVPRSLLMVHQKNGQFEVIMETMKKFTKPRALNQYPYEEKPPLVYTVGRTEEENRLRQRKKERERRRFERDARNFIQSSFKNMCKEICLKTYQDALELLPNAEDPKCPCFVPEFNPDEESCSCSEDENLSKFYSDTDSGEWTLEFTPPVAKYDPKYESKKVQKVDHETQYSYLDYSVKLFDSFGEPVPRFFKGPNGKTQCSDLGGFWGPGHKWLKINQDGIIGPDGKWAPMSFMGPGKEKVDILNGKIETDKGEWLTVGVDGYVNEKGVWQFYPRTKRNEPHTKKHTPRNPKQQTVTKVEESAVKAVQPAVKVLQPAVKVVQPLVKVVQPTTKVVERSHAGGDKKENNQKKKPKAKPEEVANNIPINTNFSCFGDACPRQLTTMGFTGHGNDKKLLMRTLSQMLAEGIIFANSKSYVPRAPKNARGMQPDTKAYFIERDKCHHAVPSDKGIVAVDDLGNKTYFTLNCEKKSKHEERVKYLEEQGIRLSSFHVPCLHSFIGTELMKQQLRKRLFELYGNEVQTHSPD